MVINMKKAAILLDEGFEDLEAMAPIALLRRGGVEVDMISTRNEKGATGRFGVTMSPCIPMDEYDFSQADALILPGGPGHVNLENNEKVRQQILAFYNDEKKVLAAICASPTIFGRMGLLEGRNYTCFTSMNEDFGGNYKEDYAVTDGNLVTGKSAAGAIDFGLAILKKLTGEKHANEVASSIYYAGTV